MKKYSLIIMILLVFGLNLNAFGHNETNSGTTQSRLGDFESVAIHVPAQTELIKGNSSSVDIQMSEKTARNIEVYTDRGILVIKSKGNSWIRKSDQLKITITMPYWESIRVTASGYFHSEENWKLDHPLIRNTGSCDIELKGIDADKLEYRGSGSGDLSIADLNTSYETEIVTTGSGNSHVSMIKSESFSVELTGSGDFRGGMDTESFTAKTTGSGKIIASGRCERVDLQSTGSGGIFAEDLSADEAYVRTTGSGDIILKDGAHLKEIRMTGSGTFRSI
jgi:Putative auto-transporter adhesin, head GIN domain